jgi:hypothetical protein
VEGREEENSKMQQALGSPEGPAEFVQRVTGEKARSESDELKGRRVVPLRDVMVCIGCEASGATIDSGGCAINIGP